MPIKLHYNVQPTPVYPLGNISDVFQTGLTLPDETLDQTGLVALSRRNANPYIPLKVLQAKLRQLTSDTDSVASAGVIQNRGPTDFTRDG